MVDTGSIRDRNLSTGSCCQIDVLKSHGISRNHFYRWRDAFEKLRVESVDGRDKQGVRSIRCREQGLPAEWSFVWTTPGVVILVYSLLHLLNVLSRHDQNRFAHNAFFPSVKFFNRLFVSFLACGSLRSSTHRAHELIVRARVVQLRLQQERPGVELLSARRGRLRLERGSSQ